MNTRSLSHFLLAALGLATASHAFAQNPFNCESVTGDPVRAVQVYGTPADRPLEIVAAAGSAAFSTPFVIRDAVGRGLTNVQAELVLPDFPADLRFRTSPGDTATTDKRSVMSIGSSCVMQWQTVIVGAKVETVMATIRVLGRAGSIEVPVRAVAATEMARYEQHPPPDRAQAVVFGQTVVPSAGATWSDGVYSGGLAGVAITLVAPETGPSLRFPNGTNTWVAGTDYNGIASAHATPTEPGIIQVRAIYPDGTTTYIQRYVVIGPRSVELNPASYEFGTRSRIEGSVSFQPFECGTTTFGIPLLETPVRIVAGSGELPDAYAESPFRLSCSNGVARLAISASVANLPPGVHEVTAVVPEGVFPASTSAPARIEVLPSLTLQSATARGRIRVASGDPGYPPQTGKCRVRSAEAVSVTTLPGVADMPVVDLPFGAVRFDLGECLFRNNSGFPTPLPPSAQAVFLDLDEEPAPGTVAWAYGPTAARPTPHWYELRTSVAGRTVRFEVVDGGLGDDTVGVDTAIRSLVTLGVPKYAAVAGSLQGLWWSGTVENGWGLSLTQHREMLFGALFIYDSNGDPRWLTMSGGSWSADGKTFTGSFYRPKGSSDHAALASTFVPGAPVGVARLTPTSRDAITFDYTIDGISGSKQISRTPFGPAYPFPVSRFDDLWWAGPHQNGWGFSVSQQHRNYFGVIYTYDAQGNTTWLVAPDLVDKGGQVTGPLYRTKGSPWLGAAYDPAALQVDDAGTIRFYLDRAGQGWLDARPTGRGVIQTAIIPLPF